MRFWEGIRLAFTQVIAQKLKSFFGVLGIVIGITFLITVITMVEGMNSYVRDDLAGSLFGVNTFTVSQRPRFTTGDVDDAERRRWWQNPEFRFREIEVVQEAVPNARAIAWSAGRNVPDVRYGQLYRRNVSVVGGSPEFGAVQGWTIAEGRGLTRIDNDQALPVAVIGAGIEERLFPSTSALGRRIRAGGQRFQVVGVMERLGGLAGASRDAAVLIPFQTFQKSLARTPQQVDEIVVKVNSSEEIESSMAAVEGALRRDRRLHPSEPNNFGVSTSSQALGAWETINNTLLVALPGLVGVSLVVGGIVIMNIMLLSVSDRTREIGLRKSLGAKRKDILFQFLTESSMLSVTGSILGILAGLGLAAIVESVSAIPAAISTPSLILAVALGLAVGITSGLYPAHRASILDPIEALRFE